MASNGSAAFYVQHVAKLHRRASWRYDMPIRYGDWLAFTDRDCPHTFWQGVSLLRDALDALFGCKLAFKSQGLSDTQLAVLPFWPGCNH